MKEVILFEGFWCVMEGKGEWVYVRTGVFFIRGECVVLVGWSGDL